MIEITSIEEIVVQISIEEEEIIEIIIGIEIEIIGIIEIAIVILIEIITEIIIEIVIEIIEISEDRIEIILEDRIIGIILEDRINKEKDRIDKDLKMKEDSIKAFKTTEVIFNQGTKTISINNLNQKLSNKSIHL